MGRGVPVAHSHYQKRRLQMIDVKKVKEEAEKEIMEERLKSAKIKVKKKLSEIDDAKLIVKNLERELVDLYDQIGTENS